MIPDPGFDIDVGFGIVVVHNSEEASESCFDSDSSAEAFAERVLVVG